MLVLCKNYEKYSLNFPFISSYGISLCGISLTVEFINNEQRHSTNFTNLGPVVQSIVSLTS